MLNTKLQQRIDYTITKGKGYNTETIFINKKSPFHKLIKNEDIKNTFFGLKAHLYGLEMNELKIEKIKEYHLSKKNLFNKIKCANSQIRIDIKKDRLKSKAINKFIKSKGGYFNLIEQDFMNKIFGKMEKVVYSLNSKELTI